MSAYWFDPANSPKRGRPRQDAAAAKTRGQYRKEWKQRKKEARLEDIAILDFETDPFDNTQPDNPVYPFTACLYRENAAPIIIWENDYDEFVRCIYQAIYELPGSYTIYAHNGGKFDFQFLLHRLRGHIKFKGRAIMSARIGKHELRDSFHIIPERLANFKKDDFDYDKMRRANRERHRTEIITYMTNDCAYLLDIVKSFVQNYGFKISIGQAALAQFRKHYNVKRISEYQDGGTDGKGGLRQYFLGGRVECLAGKGHFTGDYKLFDVNSMYPAVMANCRHPIGNEYAPRRGYPNDFTAFIHLECRNFGAFVKRIETGETTADVQRGSFRITKHEYDMALKLALIDDVEILECIDCNEFATFEKFVHPLYEKRQGTKRHLKYLVENGFTDTREYNDTKKDDIFYKLLLNNCYGKFAQNPRKFKDTIITDLGVRPDDDVDDNPWPALPSAETALYALWERESRPWKFFNVGTGASITGAARAVLMEAIEHAVDPIYCDTDSVICRDLRNVRIDPVALGAWDIEARFSEVLIAGKKLYATRDIDGKDKVKSKGVADVTWAEVRRLLDDEIRDNFVVKINKGPTITRDGRQFYMERRIRATAPRLSVPNYAEGKRNVGRISNL